MHYLRSYMNVFLFPAHSTWFSPLSPPPSVHVVQVGQLFLGPAKYCYSPGSIRNRNNNNNNNNVTLIRHVNVAKHHTIMQEVLRANSLVHGTRRHTNLSSPQVDLIHSFDVLYDTNQSQSKSRWASICMAKAGREHVYIMRGSGGCNNILKLHLTSRCGEKEVIWLGRRSRKDDVDGNKRMVRAMAVVEDDHNDHDHRNTIVTSEQSARGNRHEIRVWQSESESGSDHYNNNNYYKRLQSHFL